MLLNIIKIPLLNRFMFNYIINIERYFVKKYLNKLILINLIKLASYKQYTYSN